MKNTKNTQKIKELIILIRKIKNGRKEKNPDYLNKKGYIQHYCDQESFEARCRSVAQALINKKIKYSEIETLNFEDLEILLSELGIELYLRPETTRLSPIRLIEYMVEEE